MIGEPSGAGIAVGARGGGHKTGVGGTTTTGGGGRTGADGSTGTSIGLLS